MKRISTAKNIGIIFSEVKILEKATYVNGEEVEVDNRVKHYTQLVRERLPIAD